MIEASAPPAWALALEAAAFGDPWPEAAPGERIWLLPELALARWSVVPAAEEAELLRIAVAPEARGRGLGRTLLEACQAHLAEAGVRELFLEVREGNAPARALYAAAGWAPCGRRPRYYADGEDAVLYRRSLGR